MVPGFDLYRFLQGLHADILQQRERLENLEQSIRQLDEAVKNLQEKPTTHVDRIEYRFDQLKVETLEGTLNIGITPQAGGTIEDYAAGQTAAQDVKVDPQTPDAFRRIQDRVHRFLNQDVDREIKSLEARYNKIVGTEYRRMLVNDLRNQAAGRIREYMQRQSAADGRELDRSAEDDIVERMTRDIREGLDNYFNRLSEQEGENDEAGSGQ